MLGMDRNDQHWHDTVQKLSSAHDKLVRHERLTRIIIFFLTYVATVALGLLMGHIMGMPLLSHH
jgi:energy-converting hydrogenase Eha subunit F